MEAVCSALSKPGLVSLLGPGGVGKTRLAGEVAKRLEARMQAVFVWLDEVEEPGEVAAQFANALGIPGAGALLGSMGRRRPSFEGPDERDRISSVLRESSDKLLVIDNAEHVVEAVRGVVELLPLDDVRVLVTSRVPLDHPAERRVRIEQLPVDEARRLLIDRAKTHGVELPPSELDELVTALDCLPLAIELVAPRTVILSVGQILADLQSSNAVVGTRRETRHGSLDRTIRWSWELLDDEQRSLAATVAWFDQPIAPSLAVGLWPELDVVSLAQELEAGSWLRVVDSPHGKRWTTLWAMRRFVAHSLEEPARAERLRRLLEWAAKNIEQTSGWWAEHVPAALEAVRGFRARGDQQLAARLLCRSFFGAFGGPYFAGAMDSAADLLGSWDAAAAPEVWATLAAMLSKGALRHAGKHDATRWAERAHAVAPVGTLSHLTSGAQLVVCLLDAGRREESERILDEVVADLEQFTHDMSTASALLDVATAAHEMGRFDVARQTCERVREIGVSEGNCDAQARAWIHLSYVSYDLGEYERAAREVASLDHLLEDRHPHERLAIGGAVPAMVMLQLGREQEALEALEERAELARDTHYRSMEFFVCLGLAEWAARHEPAEARGHLERAGVLARISGSAKSLAHVDFLVALDHAAHGDFESALRIVVRLRDGHVPARPEQWFAALDALEWFCATMLGDACEAPATPLGRLARAASSGDAMELDAVIATLPPATWSIPGLYMVRFDESMQRLARGAASRETGPELRIERSGHRFRLDDHPICDISRRGAIRRILVRLAEHRIEHPGEPLAVSEVIAAGWPGEKILHEAALTRVYTTMNRLRNLEVGQYLLTLDEGYALDSGLRVVWSEDLRE